jgi:hypothetical protein
MRTLYFNDGCTIHNTCFSLRAETGGVFIAIYTSGFCALGTMTAFVSRKMDSYDTYESEDTKSARFF